jgi:hypothetical protein
MTMQCEGPPRREAAPLELSALAADDQGIARNTAPAQAEVFRNPRAVGEAKLELLREAIFENLGAAGLFIGTAQLLIEARDDAGMRHSIRMDALHFKAAVTCANELSSVKAAGR